jgi:hypothetical protein
LVTTSTNDFVSEAPPRVIVAVSVTVLSPVRYAGRVTVPSKAMDASFEDHEISVPSAPLVGRVTFCVTADELSPEP